MDVEVAETTGNDTCYDFKSLLSTPDRDFLIRNNGDKVKIDDLSGKIIALLFSHSNASTSAQYFSNLVETYNEISPKGEFEIIYITDNIHDKSFHDFFSNMPWLAIPPVNKKAHKHLKEVFKVVGLPRIVILDADGKVLCQDAFRHVGDYGVEAYPFSPQRIREIEEHEKNQSLRSFLISDSLDFLISNDGNKVPVSELDGKMIGIYIPFLNRPFFEFTPTLIEVYRTWKERGENFEIVFIALEKEDYCKKPFEQKFGSMPWYALPFQDRRCNKLARYFDLYPPNSSYHNDYSIREPILIIIRPDGKNLSYNATEVITEHGAEAYPFTLEKLTELKEVEKAKQEAQTLQSLLILGDQDFVIGKDGVKIPVTDLVGKTTLLFFLERWYSEYNLVLQELTECYDDIKEKNCAFEVILVPYNMDGSHFHKNYSAWPWLALPFGDDRILTLSRTFKFYGRHAMFVVLGPTGRTLTKEAWKFIKIYGAEAYPFNDKHLRDTEARFMHMVKGWPEKVKCTLNENHELVLTLTGFYKCCECSRTKENWEFGRGWSYNCDQCIKIYHPKCALKEESKHDTLEVDEEADAEEQSLTSIFATCSCEFLISNEREVSVSELEGKMVGLYFYSPEGYEEGIINNEVVSLSKNLKKKGENFEVVFVYINQNKYDFKQKLEGTPWFAVPYKGKCREKLANYFNNPSASVLIIFGPDGKIINSDAVEVIKDYGYVAFPFTPERSAELEEIVRVRMETLTLESLLISWEKDFVIDKEGTKIPVTNLMGKNILLHFSYENSSHEEFLPLLIKAYHEIKAKDDDFEVICVCDDTYAPVFDQIYSEMPWLALPCGDRRINLLFIAFDVNVSPLIAFGPTGHIITRKAQELIVFYGADAYPFTDEHLIEVEARVEDMATDWPEMVKHHRHTKYDLVLQYSRRYQCKECNEEGVLWTYVCRGCNFKYHPNCALGVDVGRQKCVLPSGFTNYWEDSLDEEWTCDKLTASQLEQIELMSFV